MIHLFTGCKEICKLPGRACTACGQLCDQIDCKPCQECFDECTSGCCNFINKPLGLYVVIGVLLSALEIACCMMAMVEGEGTLKDCHFKAGLGESVGVLNWLYGQLGCAWLNLIFTPYIQYRLYQNLQENAASSAGAGGTAQLSKAQVKAALSDVFWNDIGVCVYVFVLIGSAAWSYLGFTWIQVSDVCDPGGYSSFAVQLGMLFCMMVVGYFVCWNFYLECMSSMEVRAQQYHLPQAAAAFAQFNAQGAGRAQAPPQQGFMGGLFGSKPPPAQASAVPPAGVPLVGSPPKPSGCQRALRASQLGKLLLCLMLDAFGDATYAVPAAGEGVDVVYAPVQAVALRMLFQSNAAAFFAFSEEILPFTDVIPSATICWVLDCLGWFDPPEAPGVVPGTPVPSAPPHP